MHRPAEPSDALVRKSTSSLFTADIKVGLPVRIRFPPAESLQNIGSSAAHGTSCGCAFSLGEHKVTPSRNCLTANSVTHLSGRFLRLGKSINGRTEKGRRAKGQPALSRGGEQTTRYCAPKSSSGYTAENTRFRFAVRGYSQTGRQAKPNRLSSRRRLLISSLDPDQPLATARGTRCRGVDAPACRQFEANRY